MKSVVLKSSSPRRYEILNQAGFNVIVSPSSVDESIFEISEPGDYVMKLALAKLEDNPNDQNVYLAADTIVYYQGEILGKPKDASDAKRMLSLLSNQTHQVYSGVALQYNNRIEQFYVLTEVAFYEMTDEEINAYIETGEAYGKAGAYAIQGIASKFIKGIIGDYYNVMGLPIGSVYQMIKKITR